jgi:uncharacterized protein involved in cysteine biosynthesis
MKIKDILDNLIGILIILVLAFVIGEIIANINNLIDSGFFAFLFSRIGLK